MKSAVCDDNDHDSCSGKFYKHDDISKKNIRNHARVHVITRKKEDLNDGSSARHVHRILL
ncbi:MAG: hypothetical protein ACJ73C_01100 [Nitrososphaeraceae archaeon]